MEKQNGKTRILSEDCGQKIAEIVFCILFFSFFIWLIYDEHFNYDSEYEITTGVIVDILEQPGKDLSFDGHVLHSRSCTNYTLVIDLASGERIELTSEFFDEYSIGDSLKIRKVYRIKDDKKELVNYNILTN